MRELRLCGGGETATATSGWNNNNANNATAPYSSQPNSGSATAQGPPAQWNNNNANNTSPQQPQTTGK